MGCCRGIHVLQRVLVRVLRVRVACCVLRVRVRVRVSAVGACHARAAIPLALTHPSAQPNGNTGTATQAVVEEHNLVQYEERVHPPAATKARRVCRR